MSDIVPQNNDNSNNNSSPMVSLLTKLLGKIMLKKSAFFGLDTHKITVIISPSMKIYGVYASPERIAKKVSFLRKRKY